MTEIKHVIRQALEARKNAYAPYSGFCVGAALLTADGKIFTGCNIENASYSPSICAERTAFFKAVSEGERTFEAIAIVGGLRGMPLKDTPPCGVCRQVMREFCNPAAFRIIMAVSEEEFQIYTLEEMLPYGFGPDILRTEEQGGREDEDTIL